MNIGILSLSYQVVRWSTFMMLPWNCVNTPHPVFCYWSGSASLFIGQIFTPISLFLECRWLTLQTLGSVRIHQDLSALTCQIFLQYFSLFDSFLIDISFLMIGWWDNRVLVKSMKSFLHSWLVLHEVQCFSGFAWLLFNQAQAHVEAPKANFWRCACRNSVFFKGFFTRIDF